MKKLTIAATALVGALAIPLAAGATGDKTVNWSRMHSGAFGPPNVLVIIADDFGQDKLATYVGVSDEVPPSPYLDALARHGVTFTESYSAPNCSPTRAHLATGQYGFRTGITNVVGAPRSRPLDPALPYLLPKLLGERGYKSAMIGKWNLSIGQDNSEQYDIPIKAGYDYFYGTLGSMFPDRIYPPGPETPDGVEYFIPVATRFATCRKDAGAPAATNPNCWRVEEFWDGVSPPPPFREYAPTITVNQSRDFINAQRAAGKPWFVNLSFHTPHAPFVLPPRALVHPDVVALIERELGGYVEGKRYAVTTPGTAETRAPRLAFAAMVSAMDTLIGELLASIDLRNTYVIFIGDNGTPFETVAEGADPFAAKSSLFEGGVKVPFIVAGPRVSGKGRVTRALVNTTDLYTTILQVAGVNTARLPHRFNETFDGLSFLPVLDRPGSFAGLRRSNYAEIELVPGVNPGVDPATGRQLGAGPLVTGNVEGYALRNDRYKILTRIVYDIDGSVTGYPGSFICKSGPQPTPASPTPCPPGERVTESYFFDLKRDPQEMTNLLLKPRLSPSEARELLLLQVEALRLRASES